MIRIGIIGKTNTGKTTFFNAATSSTGEVSTYPFTTKKQNTATGQVQTLCVCRELGVTDKPRNSTCIDGWRFIPIEVIDLPGLIKGAFEGKGIGNPVIDVYDIEEEMILWFKVAIDRALQRTKKKTLKADSFDKPISKEMAGIGVKLEHVSKALEQTELSKTHPREWKDSDSRMFSETLRTISKPTVIIANKMDLAYAEKNF